VQINGHPVHVFSTYHPNFLSRDNNGIFAIAGHMGLVSYFFAGIMATPTKPNHIPLRVPIP
jgi:hypothetical protein